MLRTGPWALLWWTKISHSSRNAYKEESLFVRICKPASTAELTVRHFSICALSTCSCWSVTGLTIRKQTGRQADRNRSRDGMNEIFCTVQILICFSPKNDCLIQLMGKRLGNYYHSSRNTCLQDYTSDKVSDKKHFFFSGRFMACLFALSKLPFPV